MAQRGNIIYIKHDNHNWKKQNINKNVSVHLLISNVFKASFVHGKKSL